MQRAHGRPARCAATCACPSDAERPLLDAYRRGDLSARGRDRALRVARTIADLAGQRRGAARARGRGARLPPRDERRRRGGGVSGAARALRRLPARGRGSSRGWPARSRSRRHQKRRLREILALSEEQLVAALGGARAGAHRRRVRAPGRRRAARRGRRGGARRRLPPRPRLPRAPARPRRRAGRALRRRRRRPAGGARAAPTSSRDRARWRSSGRGGRRPTALEVARALGRGLAAAGVTVVSGMALGRRQRGARRGARVQRARRWRCWPAGRTCPIRRARRACTGLIAERGCVVGELPPGFARAALVLSRRATASSPRSAHMTIVVEAARALGLADHRRDRDRPRARRRRRPGPGHGVALGGDQRAAARRRHRHPRRAPTCSTSPVGVDRHEAAVLQLEPRLRGAAGRGRRRPRHARRAGRRPRRSRRTLAALTELELLGHLRRAAGGRYVVIPT